MTSSHCVEPPTPQVTKAVISVPAYFDERQREATMDAGEPWAAVGISSYGGVSRSICFSMIKKDNAGGGRRAFQAMRHDAERSAWMLDPFFGGRSSKASLEAPPPSIPPP